MPRLFEEIIVRSIRDLNGTLIGGGSGSLPGINAPQVLWVPVDYAGAVLAADIVGDAYIPFSGVITGWTLLADQVGDVVFDIWKDTYANFPPTVADTITAAAKPTIVAGQLKGQSATLTGWTTAFSAGDIFRFNIDSANTITRVLLALSFYKT
jgi:hypothetical protein